MPKFYASTSRGLAEVLTKEIEGLGIKVLETDTFGCLFDGNWADCFKVNLCSRIATRISIPILEFTAYNPDEVYNNVIKHDFTKYFRLDQSLMVIGRTKDSAIQDQRILTLKVKDAIVDNFREKFGERPNVDKDIPDARFSIHGYKNKYHLAVDTSGGSLSQRGYRRDMGEAPLREHLAAGLIALSGWDGKTNIVDPMCGSGTFLIEAALMAQKVATGTFRKKFAWENFSHIDKDRWNDVVNEVVEEEVNDPEIQFFGFDSDYKVLQQAKANAERAGVDHLITFEKCDVAELTAPCEKGMIITNPPYGIRMGDEFFLSETYKNLGWSLKQHFKGWDLWLLSGDAQWTRNLKMKATQKVPVFNGNIDCRFIHYQVK